MNKWMDDKYFMTRNGLFTLRPASCELGGRVGVGMYRYALRRLASLVPVLVGVAFIVFTLLYMTPGDPARMVLGDLATDEMIAAFREKEGLDDPFPAQAAILKVSGKDAASSEKTEFFVM